MRDTIHHSRRSWLHDALWGSSSVIGGALIIMSVGIIALTFPARYHHHILVPSLVPVFGVHFAIIFIAVQYALLALMRSWPGLAIFTGAVLLGMAFGRLGMNTWLGYADVKVAGFTAARHVALGGACSGALILGATLVSGRLWRTRGAGL